MERKAWASTHICFTPCTVVNFVYGRTSKRRGCRMIHQSVDRHRLGGLVRATERGGTWSNKIHGKCFTLVEWSPVCTVDRGARVRESLDEFSKWRTMAFVVDMDQLIPLFSPSLLCHAYFVLPPCHADTFSLLRRFLSFFNERWGLWCDVEKETQL